jgi:hypothetical protein
MDAELKSYLSGMETRLGGHISESFASLETRINAVEKSVADLRTHVDESIAASEARSREHTEMVETRLLKEFWKWAKTSDARYRQHQDTVRGLDIRVQAIEDRLSDLERGGIT